VRRSILLVAVVAAACGSSDPGNPDGAGDDGADDAADPDARIPTGDDPAFRIDRVGDVEVVEGWGLVINLYDKPFELPEPVIIASGGDCVFYQRPMPACPEGCPGITTCVADDVCEPRAQWSEAGAITFTGLQVGAATFTPGEYGYTGPNLGWEDLFADDAELHVAAAGGALPAFAADLTGVVPLDVNETQFLSIELIDGVDEVVRWTPPPAGAEARIQLALTFGWHGAPWDAQLLCETADDGELVIPGTLIAEMPYLDVDLFQWPSWIQRFRRAEIDTPLGPIQISTASLVNAAVTHPIPR
jgi:hypothetical protein